MQPETKQKLQIALVVGVLLAGARTAYIFHERSQANAPTREVATVERTVDDYVYIRPMHVTDLQSAQKLNGKELWIKAGNVVAVYPAAGGAIDTSKMVGVAPPLAHLKIKRVVKSGDQVMALFEPLTPSGLLEKYQGKTLAMPIGAFKHGDYWMMVEDEFYAEDPHILYKHWSPATWEAITKGEALKGMSEIQAGMAMGVGRATSRGSDYGNRTLEYSVPLELGEKPKQRVVDVTFSRNRAVSIEPQ